MTDTTQQEREAFEACMQQKGWPAKRMYRSVVNDNYAWVHLNQMWEIWQAARATPQVGVPKGYKLVMVPDETAPNEPDWEECKRQTEVATGLKIEQHTFSILKREVRRWIAHKADSTEPKLSELRADAKRLDWLLFCVSGREFRRIGVNFSASADRKAIDAAIDAELARQEGSAT